MESLIYVVMLVKPSKRALITNVGVILILGILWYCLLGTVDHSETLVLEKDQYYPSLTDSRTPVLCKAPYWNGSSVFIPTPRLEPNCSASSQKSLIIYSYSAIYNFQNRQTTREAFRYHFKGTDVGLLFVVGFSRHPDTAGDRMLQQEHATYGDILQLKTMDSYELLGLKGLGVLNWLERCGSKARFYAKIDDDWPYVLGALYVAYDTFLNSTESPQTRVDSILCLIPLKNVVAQGRKWKQHWEVTDEQYRDYRYPLYCMGNSGLFIPRGVIRQMLQASSSMNLFKIDDVYMTGLLRVKACVHIDSICTMFYIFRYLSYVFTRTFLISVSL